MVKNTFDLNMFIDKAIWGSADELLRVIDNKYYWKKQIQTYSYEKRNLTTSHIHAMLATSIYSVMDKTEVLFSSILRNQYLRLKMSWRKTATIPCHHGFMKRLWQLTYYALEIGENIESI